MSILRWLGLAESGEEPVVDSVAAIETALEGLPPERARFLACFGYILSRVALADQNISEQESLAIEAILIDRGGIPADQAALVAKLAKAQGLKHGGTEDFLVTRQFATLSTRDERLALLDCLFVVSAADDSIRTVEDNAIRQIASELKLEHADFIAARAAYVSHLQVLKKPT